MSIRFGTSGWQPAMADEFTRAGGRSATKGFCAHFRKAIGFKHIGELINEDKFILGGQESAELSIKGHYPEKDGLLAGLLATEAGPARGASLKNESSRQQIATGRRRLALARSRRLITQME